MQTHLQTFPSRLAAVNPVKLNGDVNPNPGPEGGGRHECKLIILSFASATLKLSFLRQEETIKLEIGEFKGLVVDNVPNGPGVLDFNDDDPMGRLRYEGDFVDGKKTGQVRS